MLEKRSAKIVIHGKKLSGGFALVRTRWGGKKNNWLLIKEKDDQARPGSNITDEEPLSAISGRGVEDLQA